MVRRWGNYKRKEAFGNDVSLYQKSKSSFGESNSCPVYFLINTAVLWSCTTTPRFHYLHWSYYDHWTRVTLMPGWFGDSGTLIFCFGSCRSLSISQNAMFFGGEWAAAYCAPQCHWAFSALFQHIRVFLRQGEHVCRCDSVSGWVCVCRTKRKRILSVWIREKRDSLRYFQRGQQVIVGWMRTQTSQHILRTFLLSSTFLYNFPPAVCFSAHNLLTSHDSLLL